MKILIISPYLPHPLSGHGTGVFMDGLLKNITPKHDVTLVTFCDQKELTFLPTFQQLPIRIHYIYRVKGIRKNLFSNIILSIVRIYQLMRSLLLWQPYAVSKFYNRRMARLVTELTMSTTYDIVQLELLTMAQYVKYIRCGKLVLHAHDVSYRPAYRRYKHSTPSIKKIFCFFEWCRWYHYERKVVKKYDQVLSVTEQDKYLLEWLSGLHNISYFPRGIDVLQQIPSYSSRLPQSLLFVGTFSHTPNIDAVHWLIVEILPLVINRFPGTILTIIGSNPPSELGLIAQRYKNIKILGFVENIKDHLMKCSLFVAPLRFGGGVKVKILHAMAHGIPVVTTKVGAEGIEGIKPECPLVGDTAQKIADHICNLFENQERADKIGRMGHHIITEYYSWDRIVRCLEEIYTKIL